MSISPDPENLSEHRHKQKIAPTRSREYKWTRSSRKHARRKSNSGQANVAKSGMHRRRNRRMSW